MGYRIPKGTPLVMPLHALHVSSSNYLQPDKFLRERWLESNDVEHDADSKGEVTSSLHAVLADASHTAWMHACNHDTLGTHGLYLGARSKMHSAFDYYTFSCPKSKTFTGLLHLTNGKRCTAEGAARTRQVFSKMYHHLHPLHIFKTPLQHLKTPLCCKAKQSLLSPKRLCAQKVDVPAPRCDANVIRLAASVQGCKAEAEEFVWQRVFPEPFYLSLLAKTVCMYFTYCTAAVPCESLPLDV